MEGKRAIIIELQSNTARYVHRVVNALHFTSGYANFEAGYAELTAPGTDRMFRQQNMLACKIACSFSWCHWKHCPRSGIFVTLI